MELFRLREVDPALLAIERERVLALLHNVAPDVPAVEVGSTAVEGVIGKQDLDIAMSVPAPRFGSVRLLMDRHFARNEEQLSNTEYQAYDIPSELKVSVQLFIQGGDFDRFSEFVEALKADPRLVAAYNTLKREWDGRPMNGYREAKAHFISAVLRNAATL